jgi:hypothetical protein
MGMAGIPALMGIDISGSFKPGIPGLGPGTPADMIHNTYVQFLKFLLKKLVP